MRVRILASKFVAQILLLVLFFCAQLRCDLTPHFREFLDQKYGTGTGTKMSRVDMGQLIGGSFGGKREQHDPVIDQPVIFIHGVTLRASVFMQHRNYFLNKGYSPAELYATTYSDGGQTPFYNNELKCKDVKHIREFIQAVHQYTNSTVDIIAYSMGCAISRKALLGGHCADTGEALGPPLTSMVDTFVSVGGVAYGMERCPTNLPACNEVTGMICTSAYMRNVNGQPKRYEGANSFGIYSKEDGIVGQQCCDHPCSELKNANQNIALRYHDHISIFTRTMAMQYSLVSEHTTGEEAEAETKNARGRR